MKDRKARGMLPTSVNQGRTEALEPHREPYACRTCNKKGRLGEMGGDDHHDHSDGHALGAEDNPHRLGAFVRSLFTRHPRDPIAQRDSVLETSARTPEL